MPLTDLLSELGLMPLRAIAFQSLLLLVAIVLEAIVLRQRLRLGYQTSMQYAATVNLLTTSVGWLVFLTLEAVLPLALRQQIISFVLFNRFFANGWMDTLPVLAVVVAIVAFFITYWLKLKGLDWLLMLLERNPVEVAPAPVLTPESRQRRYELARRGQPAEQPAQGNSPRTLAVLQANALSFSAILVLLLLRSAAGGPRA
ncbi:MAG: filament integrity protein FraC [Nodosilinea sp.]